VEERAEDAAGGGGDGQKLIHAGLGEKVLELPAADGDMIADGADEPAMGGGE
jgi:hypothetical protein